MRYKFTMAYSLHGRNQGAQGWVLGGMARWSGAGSPGRMASGPRDGSREGMARWPKAGPLGGMSQMTQGWAICRKEPGDPGRGHLEEGAWNKSVNPGKGAWWNRLAIMVLWHQWGWCCMWLDLVHDGAGLSGTAVEVDWVGGAYRGVNRLE